MSRITIYFGHYGSGKTELSLKKAFLLSHKTIKTALVDLDIVNPYFRSGEQKKHLEKQGIRVIRPNFEGTNVAVPSLPGEINSIFDDKSYNVIIDVGGSPSGAAALGRYNRFILNDDYETILVVNALRPFTSTSKEIVKMAKEIEIKSRLPIKNIINNTNVAYDTTAQMVEDGQVLIGDAAKIMNLKISAITVLDEVAKDFSKEFVDKYKDKIETIKLYMRPQWLDI